MIKENVSSAYVPFITVYILLQFDGRCGSKCEGHSSIHKGFERLTYSKLLIDFFPLQLCNCDSKAHLLYFMLHSDGRPT